MSSQEVGAEAPSHGSRAKPSVPSWDSQPQFIPFTTDTHTLDIPLCIPRVTKGFLQLHLLGPSLSKTTTYLPLVLGKTPSNFFNPYNLKSSYFVHSSFLKQLNCSYIRVFKKNFISILDGLQSSPIEYWSVCWPRHPLAHCLVAGWTLV